MTQPVCAQLRPELAPPEVMMLGDSITEAGPWQALFPKSRIVNRGVSGYTTYDLLREMKATVALRPAKVFLMIGINDLLRRATVEQTFKQYTLIVDELQKNKITVVMQATLECSRPQCGGAIESVRSLNQKLQAFAVARNIRVWQMISKACCQSTRSMACIFLSQLICIGLKDLKALFSKVATR
jgi:hypothetical protein